MIEQKTDETQGVIRNFLRYLPRQLVDGWYIKNMVAVDNGDSFRDYAWVLFERQVEGCIWCGSGIHPEQEVEIDDVCHECELMAIY